ncbi:MAG: heme exporter protein CcmB, partial [Planctomycetes bacterium]|nr:heme exporter protein CcmB [Planctomycetota bacterium]
AGLESRVGPVVFWIAVLFAGTVGLSQSFAADRERGALEGILLAPLDAGIFYLAKVAATWTYVMIMEAILVLVYCPLFNLSELARLPPLFAALGVFTLGYMAAGVLLAAMTTSLRRGGEVVLRILLFPLLLPVIYLTLRSQAATFGVDVAAGALGPCLSLPAYAVMVLAFDVIYLLAGFLIFPKVVEE